MRLKDKSVEELEKQIEEETKLIEELESSYPEFVEVNGDRWDQYREENKGWSKHHTAVRDAYWRRRMCKTAIRTKDEEENKQEDAMWKTAEVY
jgi:ABC-type transporter lipoprotein component MlaA